MAVFYKLYQIMKEGSADQGKWRVRVVPQGVVTTKELAKIMEQNCTVKSSDINAVLRELAETMKTSLLDGNRVVLDGLGAFKVTLKCTGTEKKEDFKKAGIEYTIRQIDEYRACGINGIHLYALNKYDDVARIAREAGLLDLI